MLGGLSAAKCCVGTAIDSIREWCEVNGCYLAESANLVKEHGTRLLKVANKVVRQFGNKEERRNSSKRPSQKLSGWGKLFEICTSEDSTLGKVASEEYEKVSVHRITQHDDFSLRQTVDTILKHIAQNPGWSIHASLPCTIWSQWQRLNHSLTPPCPTLVEHHVKMLRHFIEVAEAALAAGGHVSFEWPRHCSGWLREELMEFIHKHNSQSCVMRCCPVCLGIGTLFRPCLAFMFRTTGMFRPRLSLVLELRP